MIEHRKIECESAVITLVSGLEQEISSPRSGRWPRWSQRARQLAQERSVDEKVLRSGSDSKSEMEEAGMATGTCPFASLGTPGRLSSSDEELASTPKSEPALADSRFSPNVILAAPSALRYRRVLV